jgi:quercetin dioxygenase-like cupin family protein
MTVGILVSGTYRRSCLRSDAAASPQKEETMITKIVTMLAILTIGGALDMAAAQQAPTENKGVKPEVLSGLKLSTQGLDDFSQRQMRMRQITLEPGGVVGLHSHKGRPTLSYIVKGVLTEHRKGSPDRTYKAGEAITEGVDVEHWAENTSATEPVVIVTVDLFKE